MRRASPTTLVVLLILAIGINYLDRGSLSVAKPALAAEYALNPTQMGFLFSAFFWSYALFQLVAGWLVDRYDVKWVYAAGFVLWSLATLAMSFFTTFAAFFALRLLLGIGESVAYPATSRLLAEHLPEDRRGLANGLIDAGSKLGPALSTLLGGLVVAEFGWRALFIVLGVASLFWLVPWIVLVPSQTATAPGAPAAAPPEPPITLLELLRRREVWGTSLGMFSLGFVWYFLLSWLPSYLVEARGFSLSSMAVLGSLPFWAMAGTTALGGLLSDRWIRGGASPSRVRKGFLIAGFLLCAVFMFPAAVVSSASVSVALLVAACASLGIYTSNVWAVTQSLAGRRAAGNWTGLQNCIGNFGGVVSPLLTGWIVTQTHSYLLAFAAASVVLLAGIMAYVFLVPKVEPIDWTPAAAPAKHQVLR
jgi:MFS family permease